MLQNMQVCCVLLVRGLGKYSPKYQHIKVFEKLW
ncbi:predicted protein [Plenodomus lingam JN3]|uniref:Predicted protein n=1 Tax=Leptosphaeria maculans (strain JN3 / isolate v23.1.3 / race Av1-4-5-6-7-8) TaxID=985895 RepID=E4ZP06_LEPMJ|nr:predicted protein [Plenodomus lingam JN3]CBX93375.1 predicted protein [Plenodomus lingam JN3]